MDEAECRTLAASARVATLGTLRDDGLIDLVPIVFALVGQDIVFAIDHKPKTIRNLGRLKNIEANPQVTVLFDEYRDADWEALWWVRARGAASVRPANPDSDTALDALQARYPQYETRRPAGPVVTITPTEWSGWASASI